MIALMDTRELLGHDLYPDDAFYYFKIAQNMVAGRGMTFDGTHPTTGFQPLYFLLLLPVMKACQGDLLAPIRISALLLTGFSVATGGLIFLLLRRLAGQAMALVGLGLWAVSPFFSVQGVNGLETGLAMFFATLLLFLFCRWFSEAYPAGQKESILFGFSAGLAVLARLDLLLLVGAMVVFILIHPSRGRLSPRAQVMSMASAGLAVWVPWALTSWMCTGRILPEGGPAVRQIALNYGWFYLPKPPDLQAFHWLFDPHAAPASWTAAVFVKLMSLFVAESPFFSPFRGGTGFEAYRDAEALWFLRGAQALGVGPIGLATGILGLCGLLWVFRKRRRPTSSGSTLQDLSRPLALYGLWFVAGYTFYAPGHWHFARYLSVPILLSTLWGLTRLGACLSVQTKQASMRTVLVSIALTIVFASHIRTLVLFSRWMKTSQKEEGFLADWERLAPRVDPSQKMGAFQAGAMGYFSGLDVINLDGKVNSEARRAIQDKTLYDYLIQNRIRAVIDWEWVFYALCIRHVPEEDLQVDWVVDGGQKKRASLFEIGDGGSLDRSAYDFRASPCGETSGSLRLILASGTTLENDTSPPTIPVRMLLALRSKATLTAVAGATPARPRQ